MCAPRLQSYVHPSQDLRYVTTYTNDGASLASHTFQRRFSMRYLQYRPPPVQLGAAAGTAATHLVGSAPTSTATAAEGSDADVDAAGNDSSALDEGAQADMERNLAQALGPLDPSARMQGRKAAQALVQHVQRAHLLTLRGLVCEWVRDRAGRLWFMGPLRTDWASLIPGGRRRWAGGDGECKIACLHTQPVGTAGRRLRWGALGAGQPHAPSGRRGAEARLIYC